ncbi:MAG: hypothetical protein AABW83_01950 [Nanoarchaeota archaeon]
MINNSLREKLEFNDGGPSLEDMGMNFFDEGNAFYQRVKLVDGSIILRDKTGRWNYDENKKDEVLTTTELLYEMERQIEY